jgi:hypothetical protein
MHLIQRRFPMVALLALAGTCVWSAPVAATAPDALLYNGSTKPWTLKVITPVGGQGPQSGSLQIGEQGSKPKVLSRLGDTFSILSKKLYVLTYVDELGARKPIHQDFVLVDTRGATVQMEALRTVAMGSNVWVHTLTTVPFEKWQDFEHQFSLNHLAPGSIAIRCDAVPDYLAAPK